MTSTMFRLVFWSVDAHRTQLRLARGAPRRPTHACADDSPPSPAAAMEHAGILSGGTDACLALTQVGLVHASDAVAEVRSAQVPYPGAAPSPRAPPLYTYLSPPQNQPALPPSHTSRPFSSRPLTPPASTPLILPPLPPHSSCGRSCGSFSSWRPRRASGVSGRSWVVRRPQNEPSHSPSLPAPWSPLQSARSKRSRCRSVLRPRSALRCGSSTFGSKPRAWSEQVPSASPMLPARRCCSRTTTAAPRAQPRRWNACLHKLTLPRSGGTRA